MTRAVVLAAGRGSRMEGEMPKPLHEVLGLPLLVRTIRTLEAAGVEEVHVVLGYEAERVRREMQRWERDRPRVHWIFNQEWEEANGVSVLAAEESVDGPFFLTMSDHLFSSEIPGLLRWAARAHEGALHLAVDRDIESVLDLDDATKVRTEGDRIVAIGKELDRYDAIDTGVFLATPALFDALREARAEGDASLSGGVRRLASRGCARVTGVEGRMWQDVDTPDDLAAGRRQLLDGLRKESDGPIARYLNRPVSIALSTLLVKTPITPNQVSISTLVISVIAAGFAVLGGYWNFLAAGALFHLASIVDGSDGEIARLKFLSSQSGEWIDTVADNLGYLAFLIGLVVGVHRLGLPDIYLYSGLLGVAAAVGSMANLAACVARERRSGSFLSVQYGYQDGTGAPSRILQLLHFAGKRDFMAFVALLLALVGQLPLGLPIFGVAATLLLFPATLSANLASRARHQGEEEVAGAGG